MLNFFIGIAFFEAGAFFGFFVAALMQAARSGEIGLNGKEDSHGREKYGIGVSGLLPKPADGTGRAPERSIVGSVLRRKPAEQSGCEQQYGIGSSGLPSKQSDQSGSAL